MIMGKDILIGIDVGGTFTDAVAVQAGDIIGTAKTPTDPTHLERALLGSLDAVLENVAKERVRRVCMSTTLITNLMAQRKTPPVVLVLLPGPGRKPESYRIPASTWFVDGTIDFRGREIEPVNSSQTIDALKEIREQGFEHLGIVGVFSPRNPSHEEHIRDVALDLYPSWKIKLGHNVAGHLNFSRRAAATAFSLMVEESYHRFFQQMAQSLEARALDCPLVILKADGGTLPLRASVEQPLESIFSGPVASAMGAMALLHDHETAVVIDVGGTTTDLALLLDGHPLFSSEGGKLEGYFLPNRAFAVRPLPVGGDSPIAVQDGEIVLQSARQGNAACLGGPVATWTDALRFLGETQIGDLSAVQRALSDPGQTLGIDAEHVACRALEQGLQKMESGIEDMFRQWGMEHVYRIWELKQKTHRRPNLILGLGAAAHAVIPQLARRMGMEYAIPNYAEVANALGAALARTTYTTTVHLDTEQKSLSVVEEGTVEKWTQSHISPQEVRGIARHHMERRGKMLGLSDPLSDAAEVLAEQFNVVQGWSTVGRIFDVKLERPCGLVEGWRKAGESAK